MIKKIIATMLLAVLAVSLLAACSRQKDEPPQSGVRTYADFAGKTIGAQTGEIYNIVARDKLSAGEVPEYTSMADLLESLRQGRIDAVITDSSYIQPLIDSNAYPEFDYIWIPKEVFANESASVFHTGELRDKYNEWLAGITADGTLAEIQERWLGASLPRDEDVPTFESSGENGVLNICDTGNFPPFTYFDANGRPTGMDYEVVSRFALHMGMSLDITMMAYEAIGPYVISGKADMSACYLTVTEDRGQSVIFGDPIVSTQGVLIVPKADGGAPAAANRPLDYTDFKGKDIAVITGVLTYNTTEKIGAIPVNYNDSASAAEDVRQGRVAGFMHALTAVQVMAAQLDGFEVVPIPKDIFAAQVAALSHDQAVIDDFNAFLAAVRTDGTLSDMQSRWFGDKLDLDAPIPAIPNSGENGIVKVAICSDSIPYVFMGPGGQFSGFSVELALRFGAYEGKTVEFTDMEFGGLIPYIVSKKADFGIANMAITEERKQSVLFTDPFFDEQHGILVLKQGGAAVVSNAPALLYTDFGQRKIGCITGTIFDEVVKGDIGGIPVYYSDTAAAIEDVRKGRIDGFITDYSAAVVFVGTKEGSDMLCVDIPPEVFAGPLGGLSMNQDIIDRFNAFLAKLKADGTLTEMQERWLENAPDLDSPMPDIPLTGENGLLKVVTSGLALPFSYFGENGELKGYSVELAMRFAANEGMDIEFTDMDFGAIIPYIASEKADFAIDAMTITEERKELVLFTDSIYDDRMGIIALKTVSPNVVRYTDFVGEKMGIITGTAVDKPAEEVLGAIPVYYQDTATAIEDLKNGRISGILYDLSTTRFVAALPGNEELNVVEVPREAYFVPLGAVSADPDIIRRFNGFLEAMKSDGTLSDMHGRWLETLSALETPMPEIPLTGENGTLVAAVDDAAIPFAYRGDEAELRGFCIELGLRFAAYEGMDIEFVPMDFGALIPYVGNGKADLGIDAITITDERRETILFTEPFYDGPLGILTLRQESVQQTEAGGGFMNWLDNAIRRNLITDNRWKMIVDGLGITMIISIAAQVFGTVLGSLVCYMLTRKSKLVSIIARFYCGLIHGMPIVVLLMITYYIIFGNTSISNVLVAIAAFTLVMGAGIGGNLKSAIDTVDATEIEAARSIGFSAFRAFAAVTLPQAIKRALPDYTNGFVELVKATAIVGYIAISDLTRAGDIIRSRTYDAYFPLLFVAVIYLIVTTICVQLFKFIVKKINGGEQGKPPRPLRGHPSPEGNGGRERGKRQMIRKSALDYRTMRTTTGGDLIESMSEVKKGDGR